MVKSLDQSLVVYGSLAPGGPNHGRLAPLGGTWTEGWVTGTLIETGWGAELGYPALVWSPDGPRVPAWLLRSDRLPDAWHWLDRLEGKDYARIRVPFHAIAGEITEGYIYAAGRKLQ